jgi:hypothetical protein
MIGFSIAGIALKDRYVLSSVSRIHRLLLAEDGQR